MSRLKQAERVDSFIYTSHSQVCMHVYKIPSGSSQVIFQDLVGLGKTEFWTKRMCLGPDEHQHCKKPE